MRACVGERVCVCVVPWSGRGKALVVVKGRSYISSVTSFNPCRDQRFTTTARNHEVLCEFSAKVLLRTHLDKNVLLLFFFSQNLNRFLRMVHMATNYTYRRTYTFTSAYI